jgi:hypothetical protein
MPLESRETLFPERITDCVRMDMGKKISLEINSSFGMSSCKCKYSKSSILL